MSSLELHSMQAHVGIIPKRCRCFQRQSWPVLRRNCATYALLGPFRMSMISVFQCLCCVSSSSSFWVTWFESVLDYCFFCDWYDNGFVMMIGNEAPLLASWSALSLPGISQWLGLYSGEFLISKLCGYWENSAWSVIYLVRKIVLS